MTASPEVVAICFVVVGLLLLPFEGKLIARVIDRRKAKRASDLEWRQQVRDNTAAIKELTSRITVLEQKPAERIPFISHIVSLNTINGIHYAKCSCGWSANSGDSDQLQNEVVQHRGKQAGAAVRAGRGSWPQVKARLESTIFQGESK